MDKKNSNFLLLALKGIAMGAADVVPGVSGGTIAFISGIYEELISSIKNLDFKAIKLFFTGKFPQFIKKINGSFLFPVIAGIGISVFSLAQVMTWLLEFHPIEIWSFFFGLIIASSYLVAKDVKHWDIKSAVSAIIGVLIAYYITVASPTKTPETLWFIFISGMIAICAMILPGISGSFILLLLGKYAYIMESISNLKITVLAVFGAGAIIGITSFSHLLSWLLNRFHDITIALLTGFRVGSLNKVWPWKKVLTTYTDSSGMEHALTEQSVLPGTFQSATGGDTELLQAILYCILGIVLISAIEYIAKRLKSKA